MSVALGRIEGMDLLAQHLDDLRSRVLSIVRTADAARAFERATEQELALQLEAIAEVGRLAEALLIDAVGEVARRCEAPERDERMTSHLGCRDAAELVQKVTRVDAQTACRSLRAAKAVRPEISGTTGEVLAAPFASTRDAMLEGVIGIDGVLAIVTPLQATAPRVTHSAREQAAEFVVAEARGHGPDGAPPACAQLLKIHARAWALALDPDGAEPRERVGERSRRLALGAATPAGVPVRGMLLPEVAAQLQSIFDSHLAPSVRFVDPFAAPDDATDAPLDVRTRVQKQHDAFAAALGAAASSGSLPTIGGHAPTLVVSVDAADMAAGTGYAHVDGCDEPISIAAARHIACAGSVQRVTSTDSGRIIAIETTERTFNRYQRRAIALRDGGCLIPGCGVPARWCEIHHVTEHARGGPTHTDNGVLLCWYHHRFLERIGWLIRMNNGVPEVRAPLWFDTSRRWRRPTTSPVRLKKRVMTT